MNDKNECIDHIGEVAGHVWRELAKVETTSISKLVQSVDAPRDIVMQAIGWLARENKIEIIEKSRGRSISLTHEEQVRAKTKTSRNEAA